MNRNNEKEEVIIDGIEAFKEYIEANPDMLITLEIEGKPDRERQVIDGRKETI